MVLFCFVVHQFIRYDYRCCFILLNYKKQYRRLIYSIGKKSKDIVRLKDISLDRLFDWLQCEKETEKLYVNLKTIEKLADKCIKEWCKEYKINDNKFIRECTVYLQPMTEKDELENLTKN